MAQPQCDSLARDRLADPVETVDHRALGPDDRVVWVVTTVDPRLARDAGGDEATVPPARAVPDRLGLDDRDPQGRIEDRERVGRPEAGEACARDRDVDLEVTVQRGARDESGEGAVEPEAPLPVALRV